MSKGEDVAKEVIKEMHKIVSIHIETGKDAYEVARWQDLIARVCELSDEDKILMLAAIEEATLRLESDLN
ncbi:MAG: hypothetical protein AAF591_23625 [Verrucomicrobiota bacterium]